MRVGYYLFGEDWDSDFVPGDRQWVLYIYSPNLSTKFENVKENTEGYLLEQRRLTYYALTNQFSDDEVARQLGSSNSFLGTYNYAAQLKSNAFATTKGVSVYTYKYGDSGIEIAEEPIQYDANLEIDQWDINYPVDINLWDGDNDEPSLGNNYYGEYDFLGKYIDASVAAAVPTGSGGVISGYLKGFGYNEFSYVGIGGTTTYTLSISGTVGLVDGNYLGEGIPTPLSFCGPGSSLSFSASDSFIPIGFTLGSWEGYDNSGDPIWKGINVGASLNFELFETVLPGSISKINVQTELYFPSPNLTRDETIDILENNTYYIGDE